MYLMSLPHTVALKTAPQRVLLRRAADVRCAATAGRALAARGAAVALRAAAARLAAKAWRVEAAWLTVPA